MRAIKTVYVINHSHTDIGFTDFQDVCFRQHEEFIDQALDLIEATADYPKEARYRWVCETTGPVERYFQHASPSQVERFRRWQQRGAIEIAGMQYNLTPLLNVEQMHRSLYAVRRLRTQYGLPIRSAMQDDVNGISWIFADLLPASGIDFLTLAVNPVRGRAPKPRPSAFWWEGPSGGRILVWNGYHYLFGRSIAGLGDWRYVDRLFPQLISKLENDFDYPYDFLCCEATHPTRVDNGPPDSRLPEFVRRWNESGRVPRLVFTTVSEFGDFLREKHGETLPTWRGDWTDWWADGVASSAYETGLNRSTHELLSASEFMEAWLRASGHTQWDATLRRQLYETMTLYDEHTWGAFSSIAAPQSLFTKAQWNRKAGLAYTAAMGTHEALAKGANSLGDMWSEKGPEGVFNLGNLTPEEAYPASGFSELLVINTLPWSRSVMVEEPELRGGTAPAGMLEMFFPPDVPWGGNRPRTPLRRVGGTVPGWGFAFVPLSAVPRGEDLNGGPNLIENAHYRIRIDPDTGALAEWLDKESNHDFAGTYRSWGLGQLVYERVDAPDARDVLFKGDFSMEEFGVWGTQVPFRYATATSVKVHPAKIEHGCVSIRADILAPGVRQASVTYSLSSNQKLLSIDWILDKEHQTDAEAVFIAFPFNLKKPQFRVDLNGIPCTPNQDQLPGTVRDWYPIQRWVDVSDGVHGATWVPLEAPLVQLGGITTGQWAAQLEPEGPTLMSWALNNHWMVNFKASQGGKIPLRYRLTSHSGPVNDVAAARFAAEAVTPPIVLRDRIRQGDSSGQFLTIPDDAGVLATPKPAEDGDGIVIRIQNLRPESTSVPLTFRSLQPVSACVTSPLEVDAESLAIIDNTVKAPLQPRGITSVRVRF